MMNKSKSRKGARQSVHGIRYMPDKLFSSRMRQTQENFSNVSPVHFDRAGEPSDSDKLIDCPDCKNDDNEWLNFKQYPFENIVLSGGGSKGYSYVGALKALEDCGILRKVKRIAGSSAGAICGALLAVGFTPQEIATVWSGDNDYVKWIFQDQECACCCCLPKVWTSFGVHASDRFYEIFGNYFAKKTNNPDITFAELYNQYGRELYIAVTNLTKLCSEYCHLTTTPDLPIRKAVRMSMSFPVFYEPVRHNLNGSTACIYTDGGTLDQYPISAFDGRDVELNHNIIDNPAKMSAPLSGNRTLGFYLMSECATDHKIWHAIFGTNIPNKPTYLPDTKLARKRLKEEAKRRKAFVPNKKLSQLEAELKVTNPDTGEMMHYSLSNNDHVRIDNLGQYFSTTIEALLISQRRLLIKPSDVHRTVAINNGYIGTSDYTIEPGDREFMIRQGYAHVKQFLQSYVRGVNQLSQQDIATKAPMSMDAASAADPVFMNGHPLSAVNVQEEIDSLTSKLAELDREIPHVGNLSGIRPSVADSRGRASSSISSLPLAPLATFVELESMSEGSYFAEQPTSVDQASHRKVGNGKHLLNGPSDSPAAVNGSVAVIRQQAVIVTKDVSVGVAVGDSSKVASAATGGTSGGGSVEVIPRLSGSISGGSIEIAPVVISSAADSSIEVTPLVKVDGSCVEVVQLVNDHSSVAPTEGNSLVDGSTADGHTEVVALVVVKRTVDVLESTAAAATAAPLKLSAENDVDVLPISNGDVISVPKTPVPTCHKTPAGGDTADAAEALGSMVDSKMCNGCHVVDSPLAQLPTAAN